MLSIPQWHSHYFFSSEYANMILMSALLATILFLGGWQSFSLLNKFIPEHLFGLL
jgi:NADH:ubiquinone oxidoreductase subunit H